MTMRLSPKSAGRRPPTADRRDIVGESADGRAVHLTVLDLADSRGEGTRTFRGSAKISHIDVWQPCARPQVR